MQFLLFLLDCQEETTKTLSFDAVKVKRRSFQKIPQASRLDCILKPESEKIST